MQGKSFQILDALKAKAMAWTCDWFCERKSETSEYCWSHKKSMYSLVAYTVFFLFQ